MPILSIIIEFRNGDVAIFRISFWLFSYRVYFIPFFVFHWFLWRFVVAVEYFTSFHFTSGCLFGQFHNIFQQHLFPFLPFSLRIKTRRKCFWFFRLLGKAHLFYSRRYGQSIFLTLNLIILHLRSVAKIDWILQYRGIVLKTHTKSKKKSPTGNILFTLQRKPYKI